VNPQGHKDRRANQAAVDGNGHVIDSRTSIKLTIGQWIVVFTIIGTLLGGWFDFRTQLVVIRAQITDLGARISRLEKVAP
jgi:hypothetical protein